MTDEQVIKAFVNGATKGRANSLTIEGDTIYSYQTAIAWRAPGGIRINQKKYSQTTSRQTGTLSAAMHMAGVSQVD